jgi:N utilization substance protein B
MGIRRKGREYALQALYLADVCKLPIDSALERIFKGAGATVEKPIVDFTRGLVHGVAAHLAELDPLIIACAQNWEMKRMAALDRNILRLGTYELIHTTDTPINVIINEAVEIAKTFSTPDSGKFVNGLLDKLKHERKKSAD